mmetsp:Transcript_90616/g.290455  ORF Transcript_90616/g.290455 Transcript_90616/m.290455 type:complete len:152 (+) Transcript_90616:324-779(+)
MALQIVLALFSGWYVLLALGSAAHVIYFANFSRSDLQDLPFQARLAFFVLVLLGTFMALRILILVPLLAISVVELVKRYNVLERLLYLVPPNRPENPESLSLEFVMRVFTEMPKHLDRPFALKAKAGAQSGSGADSFDFTAPVPKGDRRKR